VLALGTLVRALTAAPPDPVRVPALLAEGVDPATLATPSWFRTGGYTRNLIHRDARLAIVCLCWDAGASSPVHGHDGQRCWMAVAEGTLAVQSFAIVSGGRAPGPAVVRPRGRRERLRAGAIDARDPENDLHRVSSPFGRAISLHVYAAPIERCLVFDLARGVCRETRLVYDTVPADSHDERRPE